MKFWLVAIAVCVSFGSVPFPAASARVEPVHAVRVQSKPFPAVMFSDGQKFTVAAISFRTAQNTSAVVALAARVTTLVIFGVPNGTPPVAAGSTGLAHVRVLDAPALLSASPHHVIARGVLPQSKSGYEIAVTALPHGESGPSLLLLSIRIAGLHTGILYSGGSRREGPWPDSCDILVLPRSASPASLYLRTLSVLNPDVALLIDDGAGRGNEKQVEQLMDQLYDLWVDVYSVQDTITIEATEHGILLPSSKGATVIRKGHQ